MLNNSKIVHQLCNNMLLSIKCRLPLNSERAKSAIQMQFGITRRFNALDVAHLSVQVVLPNNVRQCGMLKGHTLKKENLSSKIPPPNDPERICEEILQKITSPDKSVDMQVISGLYCQTESASLEKQHKLLKWDIFRNKST